MILPLLFVGGGTALLVAAFLADEEREPPMFAPDAPPQKPDPAVILAPGAVATQAPQKLGSTGYKNVDRLLGELAQAADASRLPLGLLVGWVARESNGQLARTPKKKLGGQSDVERGLFQLTPTESKQLDLDHARLSTDLRYSINAGLLLIAKCMREVDARGVAIKGTPYYWRLVKLSHSMGIGGTKHLLTEAAAAGQAGSWDALRAFATTNDARLRKAFGPSPKRWVNHVDAVYEIGAPFGFGQEAGTSVVGGWGFGSWGGGAKAHPVYTDIIDPLDVFL